MCIERKEQWVYGGKSYDDELEAVKAALTDLGTRFVKEYHSKPLEGMLAIGADVTSLRARYIDLTDPTPQVEKAPSEKVAGEPKSVLTHAQAADKYLGLPSNHPIRDAVREWMRPRRFRSVEQALRYGSPEEAHELVCLISIAKEPGQ